MNDLEIVDRDAGTLGVDHALNCDPVGVVFVGHRDGQLLPRGAVAQSVSSAPESIPGDDVVSVYK